MVDRSRTIRNSLDDWATHGGARHATGLDLAGVRVAVRPLRADDLAGYREFVERIGERDLRLRFGRDVDPAQRTALGRLVEALAGVTLIATVASDGPGLEIAGDARARIDPPPYGDSAEFGIVVRSDLQRLGLGRALLERLITECSAHGVKLLYGLVAPCNDGMLALARVLGFEIDHVPGGTTAVVSLALQPEQSPFPRRSDERRTQTAGDVVSAA